ncbi:hypothetical protein [Chitinophaga ginsengisegetis]|uniref:hypothetical protein n=1 Tax=Chitinophaga ginsengisegetis TaxID=393003 RepID=UPI000DBA417B|nr:hypothetical protein [Chitinophaga ginsengisegetis]MDR6568830.1 hypothetical protein [Chitinophaga ginsengisegetis]MDR6649140.1 hypothetical protein [Chitinophaga ginsengisegetis]MDR6654911.1 hypothetical protein [Chitinophaga ginsengisegetis]
MRSSKVFLILFNLLVSIKCSAQIDTVVVKKQQGFLFLSAYNYMYDYDGTRNEIKLLGFHDFFYPSDTLGLNKLEGPKGIHVLKNGQRVDFFDKRQLFKEKAKVVACLDTSGCYSFKKFFIVPVIISYKQYKDYEPAICHKPFYELVINKEQSIRFEYLPQAITISSIKGIKVGNNMRKLKKK